MPIDLLHVLFLVSFFAIWIAAALVLRPTREDKLSGAVNEWDGVF